MNVEGGGGLAGGGGLSGGEFGSSIGIGSTIVNEGPLAPNILENTMPLTLNNFNSKGEIIFNPFKGEEASSIIGQAEEVAGKAWEATELFPAAEGRNLLPAQSLLMLVAARTFLPVPLETITVLKPETAQINDIQTGTYLKPEPGLVYTQPQTTPVSAKIPQDEEEAGEKIRITKKSLKSRFLKDGPTLRKRISEVGEAFNMAKIETQISGFGEKVKGFLIARLMRPNPENTSQIVKPNGPDGSYEQTRDEIKARTFNSESEVIDIVLKNNPVKEGVEGELATNEEIAKVTKYKLVKPQLVPALVVQDVKENTIEDLGLSELFPKAA